MAKRRTRWVDATLTNLTAVAGAAAPGTVVNETLVSEAELESFGSGSTIIRVVGDLVLVRAAGAPLVTVAWWLASNYAGAVFVADWDTDAFERERVMFTKLVQPTASYNPETAIDIRTKRKVSLGTTLLSSR
jgi:hypothetical protein